MAIAATGVRAKAMNSIDAPADAGGAQNQQRHEPREQGGRRIDETAILQQRFGGEGMKISARRHAVPRRPEKVAQFLRGGADDDVLAANAVRIHRAGDDVGGGNLIHSIEIDSKIEPKGSAGGPAGARNRGGQCRYACAPHGQVPPVIAHEPVGIRGHVDVDLATVVGERLDRPIQQGAGVAGSGLFEHGEPHLPSRARERIGEFGVVDGIRIGAEVDVEKGLPCAHRGQTVDQFGVQHSRPRPEADRLQAR